MIGKYAFPLLLLATTSAAGALAAGLQEASPPAGPGLTIVNEKCGFCHSTAQVLTAKHTAAEWPNVVQQMIDRGAELTPEEQGTVSSYLATNLATDKPGAVAGAPRGAQVPPGVNAPATAAAAPSPAAAKN